MRPAAVRCTDQQLDNIIAYLDSIQLSPTESKAAVEGELRTALDIGPSDAINYDSLETGEALFNLGRDSGFAGGAYACGRCHTRGWSIDAEAALPASADLTDYVDYPDGSGGYGPRLRDGIIPRQFANVDELAEFLHKGAKQGEAYGNNGLSGDGMMPGFGDNPNTEEADGDGMLTDEMIQAIARYVASLKDQG